MLYFTYIDEQLQKKLRTRLLTTRYRLGRRASHQSLASLAASYQA